MIKVGTLCWLRNCEDPADDGKVVKVVGRASRRDSVTQYGRWMLNQFSYPIDAEWLASDGWVAMPHQLIPFSDPLPDPIVTPVAEPKEQTA